MTTEHIPFPPWIRKGLSTGKQYHKTEGLLKRMEIDTICTQANCPNQRECWAKGTATVLILGTVCTRNCPFCSVAHGTPAPPDSGEPMRIATLSKELGLRYLVITSVDRDDLPDGGASQFRDVVSECRKMNPSMRFELLVPDFKGVQEKALDLLDPIQPFVFGHNVETVAELYPTARPGGDYKRSLRLLSMARRRWPDLPIKSSVMLGLGETEEQVRRVLGDLRENGCNRLCMGQYLKPTKQSLPVKNFIHPDEFAKWGEEAKAMGFDWVLSEPFARSSYHAEDPYIM
jgi:lipoic acid synthetase